MGTSTWLILWGSPVGIAIFFAGLGVLLWGLGKLKHTEAAKAEVELKERKHRIEDAVRNAKAAVEEGIVPGGGVALLQAGAAVFATPNPDRNPGALLTYYELYDLVSLQFPVVRMLGQAPFRGYTIADFAPDDAASLLAVYEDAIRHRSLRT